MLLVTINYSPEQGQMFFAFFLSATMFADCGLSLLRIPPFRGYSGFFTVLLMPLLVVSPILPMILLSYTALMLLLVIGLSYTNNLLGLRSQGLALFSLSLLSLEQGRLLYIWTIGSCFFSDCMKLLTVTATILLGVSRSLSLVSSLNGYYSFGKPFNIDFIFITSFRSGLPNLFKVNAMLLLVLLTAYFCVGFQSQVTLRMFCLLLQLVSALAAFLELAKVLASSSSSSFLTYDQEYDNLFVSASRLQSSCIWTMQLLLISSPSFLELISSSVLFNDQLYFFMRYAASTALALLFPCREWMRQLSPCYTAYSTNVKMALRALFFLSKI